MLHFSRLAMLSDSDDYIIDELLEPILDARYGPRATSMALLDLPEPKQTSAALAILSPISSLARTRASEVLTVVSRLIASMGCLLSAPHMLAVRGKSSGM